LSNAWYVRDVTTATKTAYPLRTEARARNRAALLDAAREVLAERGYGDASVSGIAARAGLSTGAVYSIFGSKAELVLALLEPGWGIPFLTDVRGRHGSFEDLLSAYGRAWRRRAVQPGSGAGLELGLHIGLAALRDPDLAARLRAGARENLTRLAGELTEAAATYGRTLERPAEEVATLLTGALYGLTHQGSLLGSVPAASTYAAAAQDLARTVAPSSS